MSAAGSAGRRKLTAERPNRGTDFAYDEARHLAAYLHARTLAAGCDVLDAGCGEGFGTVLLAETAHAVLGIDYAAEPVAIANAAYGRPGLEFRQLDVHQAAALGRRFDLVTNFQVVEHLPDPVPFVRALRDVLAPSGRLMLTTPNRLTSVSENPVHLREYTADELRSLLQPIFGEVRMSSVLGNERVRAFDAERGRQVRRLLRLDPLGLRRLLPERLVYFAFAQLSAVVRRRVVSAVSEATQIRPDDFTVVDETRPDALDLVAICRP